MERGYEMDDFSLEQYKKIVLNSSEILTEYKKKKLEDEIKDTERQIKYLKEKLSIMKDLKIYNELKEEGNSQEQIEQYQKVLKKFEFYM